MRDLSFINAVDLHEEGMAGFREGVYEEKGTRNLFATAILMAKTDDFKNRYVIPGNKYEVYRDLNRDEMAYRKFISDKE